MPGRRQFVLHSRADDKRRGELDGRNAPSRLLHGGDRLSLALHMRVRRPGIDCSHNERRPNLGRVRPPHRRRRRRGDRLPFDLGLRGGQRGFRSRTSHDERRQELGEPFLQEDRGVLRLRLPLDLGLRGHRREHRHRLRGRGAHDEWGQELDGPEHPGRPRCHQRDCLSYDLDLRGGGRDLVIIGHRSWARASSSNPVAVAIRTTDGGKRWKVKKLSSIANETVSTVACPTRSTCEAIGEVAESDLTPAKFFAYRTTDGGTSWRSQSLPSGMTAIPALACASATNCEAVGYRQGGAAILRFR